MAPDTPSEPYDLILRGGTVYDGSGDTPFLADVGIRGDTLAAIGDLSEAEASETLDATGLAIAPGFINMMSWSNESLIEDGRSQGDIRQGITLEVMGEGSSMGPLSDEMKRRMAEHQGDIRYEVAWTTLDEYLRFLETRGVSPNVASFIGAETPRAHVVGYDDRRGHARGARSDARPGPPGDGRRGHGRGLVADLPARQLRRHRRARWPWRRWRRSTTVCTPRTCGTKATDCSRPSTS